MCQHAKNEAVSLIYSEGILDLKILQSDWLTAFWYIFQEQDFSHIYNLFTNTANNNFIIEQAHFSDFWGKKFFSKKMACDAQLHKVFQHHAKIQRNQLNQSEKLIQFQENTQTDGRRKGWTDPIS